MGERDTIISALFDSDDIDAEGFGYLALNIPASDVPAVPKKRTAERPEYPIENAPCGMRFCNSRFVFPQLECFHE